MPVPAIIAAAAPLIARIGASVAPRVLGSAAARGAVSAEGAAASESTGGRMLSKGAQQVASSSGGGGGGGGGGESRSNNFSLGMTEHQNQSGMFNSYRPTG